MTDFYKKNIYVFKQYTKNIDKLRKTKIKMEKLQKLFLSKIEINNFL